MNCFSCALFNLFFVFFFSGNLKEARDKEKKAQIFSNVDSDSENDDEPLKRIVVKKRHFDESSEDVSPIKIPLKKRYINNSFKSNANKPWNVKAPYTKKNLSIVFKQKTHIPSKKASLSAMNTEKSLTKNQIIESTGTGLAHHSPSPEKSYSLSNRSNHSMSPHNPKTSTSNKVTTKHLDSVRNNSSAVTYHPSSFVQLHSRLNSVHSPNLSSNPKQGTLSSTKTIKPPNSVRHFEQQGSGASCSFTLRNIDEDYTSQQHIPESLFTKQDADELKLLILKSVDANKKAFTTILTEIFKLKNCVMENNKPTKIDEFPIRELEEFENIERSLENEQFKQNLVR